MIKSRRIGTEEIDEMDAFVQTADVLWIDVKSFVRCINSVYIFPFINFRRFALNIVLYVSVCLRLRYGCHGY